MSNIKLFESVKIRSAWNEAEQKWYFSVADVVEALTNTPNATDYIKKMRKRDEELSKGWGQFVTPLELETAGGKQKINCANAEGLLRIIQSIPSPKAEPFKRWLARVGYERLEEIENPELASRRIREIYKAKGYSDEWIEKRLRGIAVRDELTDEWKKRGVKEQIEFAILTSEISKATFGLTPSEYKELKSLPGKGENLRDHMTDLELIFTMLGEASTTEITKKADAKGFVENKTAAKKGGKIAGDARIALENETGKNIVSKENYLKLAEKKKRKLK
ncbi:MAG: phage antirepressor protein [Stygiobacter sp. RIFOXYC12_FULL_38_8]|nr:MAG: phage antirepressor protein [Stygiobacter sp. GWC2_38_9]OGU82384.1 MAG: phage antirepressor protein [Stygiobacter sp. RIFOXYA12_FULL_38_9]OGV07553.1 MAG: phage antirepressor protein [Stygiobacter sp. RIFOXYB2_FULL_37_11]OGV10646.1 MAG: phage antirepressor protein [Stygiobacter sp. RIFOXYA2_FULL_38_8]OGV13814.1 MAG: phage antirepressor protein [Stygiobacter sp. RIFOXYC2_FULL_38_25]OGV24289.1 MAG: phage antirepressor protein [Stygiobacter sp. RIFOXYC12_FULL_38_8]OGV80198.1 MAG: phage an